MRYRSFLITLLTLVMVAALATVALAEKPESPPGKPTVTTPTEPDYWTCGARVDNCDVCPLGTYDGGTGTYVTNDGPLLCVDIMEDHLDITAWTVTWSGTTARGPVKGLKFVFEEEVHGTIYAETVVYLESSLESEPWTASWSSSTVVESLVFVAMPHSGDKWIGPMIFTIMPTPPDG